MSNEDIVRAWKDAEYRQSLNAEGQALLPAHPAGAIELTDDQLNQAAAGGWSNVLVCSETACSIPYTCGDPNCPLQLR